MADEVSGLKLFRCRIFCQQTAVRTHFDSWDSFVETLCEVSSRVAKAARFALFYVKREKTSYSQAKRVLGVGNKPSYLHHSIMGRRPWLPANQNSGIAPYNDLLTEKSYIGIKWLNWPTYSLILIGPWWLIARKPQNRSYHSNKSSTFLLRKIRSQ